MSFTFNSKLGKLKMGSTPTLTLIDTTSSLNFASLKITNDLILNYAGPGILHVNSTGSVTSGLLATTDIANLAVTSEKIQDSIFLSGVPTTATADAEDHSLRIATTAFVQNTISNVLGNTPATLNTLKELADAIGNDPNFVSNIGIEIAKKVSLNGNESINGTKTFTSLPILSSLTTVGVVHNNSNGILSTDLIQTNDIANNTINSDKLKTNSVITDTIAPGEITNEKIAENAIDGTKIQINSISTTKIIDKHVTTGKIDDAAITTDKISAGAVTNNKIASGAVTNANIGNFAIRSNNLDDKCVGNQKIADNAVNFEKLDTNLMLPFNTTLQILEGDEAEIVTQSLVTVGLITSNKPLPLPQLFFHITQSDTTIGPNGFPIYTVGSHIKYILETPAKIYLPLINEREGMYFSITNKSGQVIDVSTRTPETDETSGVNMYSYFVAPDGDDEFQVGNNCTLDVISQITNTESSWQARFF